MLSRKLRKSRQQMVIRHGVSVAEAAKFLQVDHSTIYMAMQKGQIPITRRNGRTTISHGALMDYRARKRPRLSSWD